MSFLSTRMGLRVWDRGEDSYDHTQLANNWQAIDVHDHTTGKGVQIPTGGIMDAAITSPKLADLSVTTPKIANAAVDTAKLADASVTTAKLVNSSVTEPKLLDSSVTTAKLAVNSVVTSRVADLNVTTEKLANASVTNPKIGDGQVNNPKLAENSVSRGKIQDKAVNQAKIDDLSVGTDQIIDRSVTRIKLGFEIEPIGQVIMWYRPNSNTPLPTGWIPCDGRSIPAAEHDFVGGGTITIPDMRNKFVLGASTTGGTGSGTDTAPSMGLVGGSHTKTFAHDHTIGDHTHTIGPHNHTIGSHTHDVSVTDHIHYVADHNHGIFADGAHAHSFQGGKTLHSRRNAPITKTGTGAALQFKDVNNFTREFSLQSVYLAGFNAQPFGEFDDAFGMDAAGTHSHAGVTMLSGNVYTGGAGAATVTSTSNGATTTSANGATTTSSNGAQTTSTALNEAQDIRPAYVGLLFLIKVKAF